MESCVYPSGTSEGTDTLSFHRNDPSLLLIGIKIAQCYKIRPFLWPRELYKQNNILFIFDCT